MSSAPSEQPPANYIFRAKTKDAFVIKVLSELLDNALIKWAPFCIDSEGIHLKQADANNHQLICFTLKRNNFTGGYRCTKPLNFLVNSNLFYKMLKSIRKKEMITLYIKDDDTCKLGICVEASEENNKTNTHIRIIEHQPVVFREPEGYPNPTIVTNKEFQKMKNLHNISKNMQVTCPYPGLIKFFCDGQDVYQREVVLGSEQRQDDFKDEEFEEYCQNFNTNYITGLTKCANQSPSVQIFVHKNLPLKIEMKAGTLGDLSVYIKSKERMMLEQKVEADKRQQQATEEADE